MIDYNKMMEEIISGLEGKPTLLLHTCCGPCSSSVLERISKFFDVTVFFYNPNIVPFVEYNRRMEEQVRLLKTLNIRYIIGEYEPLKYQEAIKGYENLEEGSQRCFECYKLRMRQTALLAKEKNFEYFTTSLSVSPHKNAEWINKIGKDLEAEIGVKFLNSDFKKKNGYLRSLQLSAEYKMYRQNYCGCRPRGEL